jgi:hypothetical protein
MLVEPAGLCWLAGRRVASRDGVTWAGEFQRWPALRAVVRDGGTGLSEGIELERTRRREHQAAALEDGLDVFHTPREGGRALRATWAEASRARERADAAQQRCDRRACQGRSNSGHGAPLKRLWAAAEAAFTRAETAEAAWGRVRSALELFTPEGRLNSRSGAEAIASAALPELAGTAWAKTRRLLSRPESFTFLDQAARRLGELGLEEDILSALLELEGLRRQPWRLQGATPAAAAARGLALARVVQLEKTSPEWREQAAAVHRVLRGVWRASSSVECLNSVARMQQSRHRKMTQGLSDLKRLYWDLRRFRTGHRKGQTPYGLLGLRVPELSFCEFLKLTPQQLREQLSAKQHAP